MAIAFEAMPPNMLVPLFYAEVTSAAEAPPRNLRVCIIGHCNKGPAYGEGVGINDMLYLLSDDTVVELFGWGSMLHTMYNQVRKNAPMTEVWGIAVPEAETPVPTRSTGKVVVTAAGHRNRQGWAKFHICGAAIQYFVEETDTEQVIAGKIRQAINRPALPCRASIDSADLTGKTVLVTCNWAGITGNEIDITYCGILGRREVLHPQIHLAQRLTTLVQMTGGLGEYKAPAVFGSLADRPFDIFVQPYTDPGTLGRFEAFMNHTTGRWSPWKQQYGHVVTAKRGDITVFTGDPEVDPTTLAAHNDPHCTILAIWKSIIPSWEWGAALGGIMAVHWAAPPELSRPLQTLRLEGCRIGSEDEDAFDVAERNILLENGFSTFYVDRDGSCRLDRVRTMKKFSVYGEDASWADAITLFQAQYFVRRMKNAIVNAYPRAALSNVETNIQGFTSPSEIARVIIFEYGKMQEQGLVENINLFSQYLVVERDPVDHNRVNILMRPDMVNQLRVVAAIVETHLELSPGDPLLQQGAGTGTGEEGGTFMVA